MNSDRDISLIRKLITSLNLNLRNQVVLTELGSDNFQYTPIIPALSGAKKVYAWCKDSNYGKASDLIKICKGIIQKYNIPDVIEFRLNEINLDDLNKATIITNSGMIRPISKKIIKEISSNCVISLMYDEWELRKEDVDIEECTKKKIKVVAVNEYHETINVFPSVGILGLKFLIESKIDILNSNGIVWSDDLFGKEINETINKLGGSSSKTTQTSDVYNNKIDYLFLCDYDEERNYFSKGTGSIFDIDRIKTKNPHLIILHLYGKVDYDLLHSNNIRVYPEKDGSGKKMSETLSFLGSEPLIRLLIGGFKVAEETQNNQISKLSQPINFNYVNKGFSI